MCAQEKEIKTTIGGTERRDSSQPILVSPCAVSKILGQSGIYITIVHADVDVICPSAHVRHVRVIRDGSPHVQGALVGTHRGAVGAMASKSVLVVAALEALTATSMTGRPVSSGPRGSLVHLVVELHVAGIQFRADTLDRCRIACGGDACGSDFMTLDEGPVACIVAVAHRDLSRKVSFVTLGGGRVGGGAASIVSFDGTTRVTMVLLGRTAGPHGKRRRGETMVTHGVSR